MTATAALSPVGEAATLEELDSLLRLYEVQRQDSRIGFEATNNYFFTLLDLAEKVLNCEDLLNR